MTYIQYIWDLGETHIFVTKLVCPQVHGTVRSSTYLVLYDVLVYPMMGPAIVLVAQELDPGI